MSLPTSDIAVPPRGISIHRALAALRFLHLRLGVAPRQALRLPAENKGNTLRGAFGSAFRRLVCIPQCRDARHCPLGEACPYKAVFEPSPPADADRLTRNQDAPRPFIFRPPLDLETRNSEIETRNSKVENGMASDVAPAVAAGFSPASSQPADVEPDVAAGFSPASSQPSSQSKIGNPKPEIGHAFLQSKIQNPKSKIPKTTYLPGEVFEFDLILIGKAVDYLPYFVLAFREVTRQGFGLNRARCELAEVASAFPVPCNLFPVPSLVYSAHDELFHTPPTLTLADYVDSRLAHFSTFNLQLSTVFLTPTSLKSGEEIVRQPEFHHLFKRVRDRLNALSTFYGPGPIDADFKGLGRRAEQVRTVAAEGDWVERSRRSSKTHQRHELSGFVGQCTYELPVDDFQSSNLESRSSNLESGISNLELLRWLLAGELIHAGRHTAWGNGWYEVQCRQSERES